MNNFSIEIKNGKPVSAFVNQDSTNDINTFVGKVLELENPEAEKVAVNFFRNELGCESSWTVMCGNETNRPLPTAEFWKSQDDVKIVHSRISSALKVAYDAAQDFIESILQDGIYSVSETVEVSRSRR